MSHDPSNSKKPERKKRDRDDAEQTLDSLTQSIQVRFDEIRDHIQVFRTAYDTLLFSVVGSQERAQMRAREVNRKLGFFTPVVSDTERYLKMLELLYRQTFFLNASFQLKDVLSDLLKNTNLVGDMRKLFSFWHDALTSYITFVRTQVLSLMKGYEQNQDNAFKNEIKQQLEEKPYLLAWLRPFLNPELKQDPLRVSVDATVQEIREREKLNEIEVVKGAFDAEVMERLPLLQKTIKEQFEKLTEFLNKTDNVEHKTYREKVQFYADFCFMVLKRFLATIRELRQLIQNTNGYINKIRGIDPEGDVAELVVVLLRLTKWEKKLTTELDRIYRPMQTIAKEYFQHKDELPHALRVFMRPWLNTEHPYPIDASICAYEFPQDFQEAAELVQSPMSAEEKANQERFHRQMKRRF